MTTRYSQDDIDRLSEVTEADLRAFRSLRTTDQQLILHDLRSTARNERVPKQDREIARRRAAAYATVARKSR